MPGGTWDEVWGDDAREYGETREQMEDLSPWIGWTLRPHWNVYGYYGADSGCWWIVDETLGVVYAFER